MRTVYMGYYSGAPELLLKLFIQVLVILFITEVKFFTLITLKTDFKNKLKTFNIKL